jgi:hypothetical protein
MVYRRGGRWESVRSVQVPASSVVAGPPTVTTVGGVNEGGGED